MISEIKSKTTKNGSNYSMNVYESRDMVGPFISFTKDESNESINIQFGRAYAEDAKYADKTHLQLVTEALHEVITNSNTTKPVYLNAWGHKLQIPNDADRFEIQELISNFTIKNVNLDIHDYISRNEEDDEELKTIKKIFSSPKFQDACLSYIQRDCKNKTFISLGEKYSKEEDSVTYLQMAVEAIKSIDKDLDINKRLGLKLWDGAIIEIPRDADSFEIQEILTNYVLRNAKFTSNEELTTEERTK